MKNIQLSVILASAFTLMACSSMQHADAKSGYSFYLAEHNQSFSGPNGTLIIKVT